MRMLFFIAMLAMTGAITASNDAFAGQSWKDNIPAGWTVRIVSSLRPLCKVYLKATKDREISRTIAKHGAFIVGTSDLSDDFVVVDSSGNDVCLVNVVSNSSDPKELEKIVQAEYVVSGNPLAHKHGSVRVTFPLSLDLPWEVDWTNGPLKRLPQSHAAWSYYRELSDRTSMLCYYSIMGNASYAFYYERPSIMDEDIRRKLETSLHRL